jgi:hypothetical protein
MGLEVLQTTDDRDDSIVMYDLKREWLARPAT